MAQHEVEVIDRANREFDNRGRKIDRLLNGLVRIMPPISLGEGFVDAVLGVEQHGMSLQHVLSDDEATYLRIEVSFDAPYDERKAAIDEAAHYIGAIVNNPAQKILQRVIDNPFQDLG